MINFRFHIVSLIAVFLALGVGVIMGTAVIDSAVVDRLESQQRGLEADVSGVREKNRALDQELAELRDRNEEFEEDAAGRLLVGELAGQPVVIVASRGVRDEAVEAVVEQLDTAGASLIGVMWLTDRWVLDDANEVRDLAGVLGVDANTAKTELRKTAMTKLAAVLRGGGRTGGGAIEALTRARFVELAPAVGLPGGGFPVLAEGTDVVMIGGDEADVGPTHGPLELLRSLVEVSFNGFQPVAALAVEASPSREESDAVSLVGAVRADSNLRRLVATVDGVETLYGRLAAILALQALEAGRVGHYGVAEGAQGLLPPEAGA